MKLLNALMVVVFLQLLLTGCGTIRALHAAFSGPAVPPGIVQGVQSAATPATQAAKPGNLILTGSPVKTAVQSAVDWEERLMILAGVLCLLAAGALFYFQMYFMAIKLLLAGLILPIFAVWFSHYWGWIVAGALVSVAVVAFLHYRVVLVPYFQSLEKKTASVLGSAVADAKTQLQKL